MSGHTIKFDTFKKPIDFYDKMKNTKATFEFAKRWQVTDFISEINNTQINNAKDIDIVMSMCNLVEYSDIYLKISSSLWKYCRYEPDDYIRNFESFKFKSRLVNNTGNAMQVSQA